MKAAGFKIGDTIQIPDKLGEIGGVFNIVEQNRYGWIIELVNGDKYPTISEQDPHVIPEDEFPLELAFKVPYYGSEIEYYYSRKCRVPTRSLFQLDTEVL